MQDYIVNLSVLASLAAINAMALNVLIGYTGVFSAAQSVFYGLGAYVAALLGIHLGASIFLAWGVAILVAAAAGCILALPAVRVVGDHFIIVSLAFEVVAFTVFQNWTDLTGGAAGLVGIPRASVFGYELSSDRDYLWLVLAVSVLVFLGIVVLMRSPLGRALRALRDDAVAARAVGNNPARLRFVAVILSSVVSALGGCMYAGYVGFINADSFTPQASFLIIVMVVLGGAGSLWGPIIGAVFVTLCPALIDLTAIPVEYKGNVAQMLYGLALVLLMVLRPAGLVALLPRRAGPRADRTAEGRGLDRAGYDDPREAAEKATDVEVETTR